MAFESFLSGLPDRIVQSYMLISTFAPDVESTQLLREFSENDTWLFEIYAVLVAYRKALSVPGSKPEVINRLYQPTINGIIRSYQDYLREPVEFDISYIEPLIKLQNKVKK